MIRTYYMQRAELFEVGLHTNVRTGNGLIAIVIKVAGKYNINKASTSPVGSRMAAKATAVVAALKGKRRDTAPDSAPTG